MSATTRRVVDLLDSLDVTDPEQAHSVVDELLPDDSVDLIVTSPPYSDADAVEFLRPLKARLHLRGQVGAAGRRPSPRRPRLDVRLRHEHAATLADDRDVPQTPGQLDLFDMGDAS